MPEATEAEMKEKIRNIDKFRKKYCVYHTKTIFGAANCYDITFNTSKLGIDECVRIICDLARK
jgi:hypothetical protein